MPQTSVVSSVTSSANPRAGSSAGPAPTPHDAPPGDQPRSPLQVFELTLAQIGGGALAAVSAAFAASFLGVNGTLVGAAMGSVVSTVAGALYVDSLRSAARRARLRDRLRPADHGTPRPAQRRARTRWVLVAPIALAGFVVGIAALAVTELALGHPISSRASGGTTAGRLVHDLRGGPGRSTTLPGASSRHDNAPSAAPSSKPSSPGTAGSSPTAAPSTTPTPAPTPSTSPASSPGLPTPTPPAPTSSGSPTTPPVP